MTTIREYALLANAVYEDDMAPSDGWTLRSADSHARSGSWTEGGGFQAGVYSKGQELVVAFKGTDSAQDALADLKLGLGMNTMQFGLAGDMLRKLLEGHSPADITLCGHSLGGAITQVMGNRYKCRFVTFNAPGVGMFSRNIDEMLVGQATGLNAVRAVGTLVSSLRHPMQAYRDFKSLGYRVRGLNVRLGFDEVGCYGVHFGDVVMIQPESRSLGDMVPAGLHSMNKMVEALDPGVNALGGMTLSAALAGF